jgi:hypothetical protein
VASNSIEALFSFVQLIMQLLEFFVVGLATARYLQEGSN